jgi:archaellum component FlaC
MDSNGLISKSYVCESELGYLLDTYQYYEEIHNISVRGYLERLIQAHNNNTDNSKKFAVGNVTVVDNNDSLYRYIAYDTTKKNIDDDLLDKLGGELQIRYENDIRYLDYLAEVGRVCSTEIRLAKNLQDLEQNIDVSEYCNRLVVLGAKLKVKDDEGNEADTEERLTIESINNGLKYIDDKESIAKYGVIQGQVIYDDVTEAKNLLSKGQKYLLNQRLLVSNKINALDLSLIGIDIDSFEVGNYYPLIHEILGINDVVRVVEKSISIESPHANTITLGDLEKDIKKYNIQTKKGYSEAIKKAEEANNRAITVEKFATDEIYRVDGNINNIITDVGNEITNINNSLGSTSADVSSINTSISLLEAKVNKNTTDINSITDDISLIKADTNIIKTDITKVKEDISNINKNIEAILELLEPNE